MDIKTSKRLILICILFSIPVYIFSQIEEKELKLKKTLGSIELEPKEGDLLLHWPISADVDQIGNLYVLDSGNQRILKFDENYDLIWEMGRKGKGPGEFLFQGGTINSGFLTVSKQGEIYVIDNINSRVQIFDTNGNYLKSFKIPWTAGGIDLDNQDNIYLNGYSKTSKHLLYVFDNNGSYLDSFAEKLIENPDAFRANKIKFSINDMGEIFIAFSFWPLIRKYDINRKLIWEKELNLTPISKKIPEASKNLNLDNPKRSYFESHSDHEKELSGRFGPVTIGLTAFNDILFLFLNSSLILKLDINNNHTTLFQFPVPEWSPFDILINIQDFVILQQAEIFIYH